ncbi:MAG TPA: hypothetical protein ENJ09_07970 [Planctomycetes bacterium]|nr:hypothetical protein [Planctomycetota bacterium]
MKDSVQFAYRLAAAFCAGLLALLAPSASGASLSNEGAVAYAIIANPKQTAVGLSSADLKALFRADQQYWPTKEKGRVNLFLPKTGSAEMKAALSLIYGMSESDLKKHWVEMIYQNKISARPKEFPSAQILVRIVAKDKDALTIVPAAAVAEDSSVKVLRIDGKLPGDEGYPLVLTGQGAVGVIAAGAPRSQEGADGQEERLQRLENDLLDMQIELAGGGDSDRDFDLGPIFSMKGFGHVGFSDTDVDGGSNDNAFALGGLDLFITSQLAENLSFLNETVFEPGDTGEYTLDVERVILKYQVSDSLNVQTGRFHTTLGFWNETYHHGEWLQTSIDRPAILRFEDDGGLLPVHLVGLVFKGRENVGETPFDWTVEIGNGRGATPDPPQITIDANDSKAINLALRAAPSGVPGLQVGGGVYLDRIASGGNSPENLEETILNGHVVFERDGWRFIGEYFDVQHDGSTTDASSDGYYFQLARQMGEWTPYLRYDATSVDDTDPFFDSTDDSDTLALGVRWDFTDWAALKLQVDQMTVSPAVGPDEDSTTVSGQVSFAF